MSNPLSSRFFLFISLLLLLTACQKPQDEWISLFNGKDIDNFQVLNGTASYQVSDGAIVGVTKENTPNSFLTNGEIYADFILEFEVLADVKVNSGVQFRSISDPNINKGRVHGYQCEIESSPRKWAGGIYDEARRGWLYPLSVNPKGQEAFKPGEWNLYRIEAIGNSLRTWVNDIPCANLTDDMTAEGIIAFQVHSIGSPEEANREIKWKNIRIKTENLEADRTPMPEEIREISYLKNQLTEKEQAEGWELLWDGKTDTGWKGEGLAHFPKKGWKMEDGELIVEAATEDGGGNGGDIITNRSFGDFELELEFMYTPGGNSGIKYFIDTVKLEGEGSPIGLEFQILDDALHPDAKLGRDGNHTVGSLYDLITAGNLSEANRDTKRETSPGNWNKARIVSREGQVEHWLNNILVLRYDRFSESFRDLVAQSKYRDRPGFGEAERSPILLQEHNDEVHFRSIKIREF